MRVFPLPIGLIAAGVLAGCGDAPKTASLVPVRDSAGIHIVENRAPDPGAPGVVTLSAEPVLVLGELDGPAEEQFGSVDDVRLVAAGIAVLDRKNFRIDFFNLDGSFRRWAGQNGEGPGDMRRGVQFLGVNCDSLWLWDDGLRRVTAFDTAGRVLGMQSVHHGDTREINGMMVRISVEPVSRFADGRILATSSTQLRVNPPSAINHDSLVYSVIDTTGQIDSIATQFATSRWWYNLPNGDSWFGPLPLGRQGSIAVSSESWWYTDGRSHEVRQFDQKGRWITAWRVARPRRPTSPGLRNWAREQVQNEGGPTKRGLLKVAADWLVVPASLPAYDRLALDATGLLWARLFPDTTAVASWDLFDRTGNLIGNTHVPADLTIRDIGRDYLLGQRKGKLDEPLVVLYRLERH